MQDTKSKHNSEWKPVSELRPVEKDESSENVLACLLNAIAFDADWKYPYEEDDIYDGEFTNAAGSVKECKMLNSEEDWYIENETIKGTRATAVTECVVVAGGCPNFKTVILDRPFVYAIIHQATALPVFCGIVNDIGEDQ